jgi:hypothetical protein
VKETEKDLANKRKDIWFGNKLILFYDLLILWLSPWVWHSSTWSDGTHSMWIVDGRALKSEHYSLVPEHLAPD